MSIDPEVRTTPLRHVSRHLQQTVSLHLKQALTDLGWLDEVTLFGSPGFTVQLGRMPEKKRNEVEPNLIAITFGDEPPEEEQELGGGLTLLRTQVGVDVVPDTDALGIAVCSDVRDVLSGRLDPIAWPRVLRLRDYSTSSQGIPQDDHLIEFTDVQRRRTDNAEGRLHWQQVVADIELTMPGFG